MDAKSARNLTGYNSRSNLNSRGNLSGVVKCRVVD
jgi:hypothetical protein